MKFPLACVFVISSFAAYSADTRFAAPWNRIPTITVVSADSNDPRFGLVDEAVAYWNTTLQELPSGFRLGQVRRLVRPVPEEAVSSLGKAVLARTRGSKYILAAFDDLPGDLIIVLADSNFVSFTEPLSAGSKRVVGIKGMRFPPLTLPNVARNVIAHELGHAIGLGHNSDPTKLMCGRPASCRPDLFRADEPRIFSLTDEEKRELRSMYPPGWKAQIP